MSGSHLRRGESRCTRHAVDRRSGVDERARLGLELVVGPPEGVGDDVASVTDGLLLQDVVVGHHVEGVLERGLGPALEAGLTSATDGLREREDVEHLHCEAVGRRAGTQLDEPVVLHGLGGLVAAELPLPELSQSLGVLGALTPVGVDAGEEVLA